MFQSGIQDGVDMDYCPVTTGNDIESTFIKKDTGGLHQTVFSKSKILFLK